MTLRAMVDLFMSEAGISIEYIGYNPNMPADACVSVTVTPAGCSRIVRYEVQRIDYIYSEPDLFGTSRYIVDGLCAYIYPVSTVDGEVVIDNERTRVVRGAPFDVLRSVALDMGSVALTRQLGHMSPSSFEFRKPVLLYHTPNVDSE